jgi:hypothetical protein
MKNQHPKRQKSIHGKLLALLILLALTICDTYSQDHTFLITSSFNGTPIAAGNYIWFNSQIKLKNNPVCNAANPLTITLLNSEVKFVSNGISYILSMPPAIITFSTTTLTPTTTWSDAAWYKTKLPCSEINNDEVFLSGFAFLVPALGIPGGLSPVIWEGEFYSSVNGIELEHQLGAAVYSKFTTLPSLIPDYSNANIQLLHQALHAGAPMTYKDFVIGGARGGGGSNYTGGFTPADIVFASIYFPPLPITLTSFTANRNKDMANLNWATATELNCKEYMVQQKNGSQWQTIDKVASLANNGNSSNPLHYSFNHPNTNNQTSYYRLQQVDLDNTSSYSPIIAVDKYPFKNEAVSFTNPALNGEVNVHFDHPSVRDITATDLAGRIIFKDLAVTNESWQHANFAPGFYLIQISDKNSGKFSSEKVVVK